MNTFAVLRTRATRHTGWLTVGAAALALTFSVSRAQPAHADDYKRDIVVPAFPASLQVPAGNSPYLVGHAAGTQDYICLPSGAGFAWTFFGPQATLLDDNDEQIITHFLSPNPVESGKPRPTWQSSRDTSAVWGNALATATSTSDPIYVAPGAIPWLLLQVVGSQSGPTAGDALTKTTFIQRLNTSGGVAPTTGCAVSTDVGNKALVHYTANYFFYQADAKSDRRAHRCD